MKPFLVLQLRPETEASDDEFAAILRKGELSEDRAHRIRLDQGDLPEGLDLSDYSGVIVGGGPGCVSDPPEKKKPIEARMERAVMSLMPEIISQDIPYLGCCYGIGILGHYLGAPVNKARYGEAVGTSDCALTEAAKSDPLCQGLPDEFVALVGHKEAVQELPEGCTHLVSSPTCPFQMIRYGENVYATQFHPEADSAGFEVRVTIYKHFGYFPPEDADRIIALCRAADVFAPERILKNFVKHYGQT